MDVFRDFWLSIRGYHQLPKEKVYYLGDKPPRYCQRCAMFYTEVQVRQISTNRCEFICYQCVHKDDELKNLPVKKKQQLH
jgi:hypothetical protein|uniref:Uncharacterized protein n=1 Tax=viral metagenome TaxID=1070528 RepID=A0A6C0IUX5_9ZZZZ